MIKLREVFQDIFAKNLEKEFNSKYPSQKGFVIQLNKLSYKDNFIELAAIVIPKEYRNQNIGTEIMNRIIDYADENNLTIGLTPSKDFGATSVDRLKKFYKRFGFVPNKGRNIDFTISNVMYREPK